MKKIIIICIIGVVLLTSAALIIKKNTDRENGITIDVDKIEMQKAYEEAGIMLPEEGMAYTEQKKSNWCFDEDCDCERSVYKAWFWDNPEVTVIWID